MLDELLSGVMKPGRYIGREWNASKKDFNQADIKFALCFPDLYEVGMSNLGIRIIYGILNNVKDVCCERFFAPALDLENNLRKNKTEIFSLESRKSLKSFDIIGFSLGHELLFTNLLNILDLGAIPLKSSLRDCSYPLIIGGGGVCTLNPEPMYDFFDLFIIGEAEEVIIELINLYRKVKHEFKSSKIGKQEILMMSSGIEGIYVPSFYEAEYDYEGRIKKFGPTLAGVALQVKKRIVKDFDNSYFPTPWLVPFIQIVHDRITLEIMRGCPNKCRFCQARQQYYPFRLKSIKNILDTAIKAYKLTGYDEIALGGLSVTDYPRIEELVKVMIEYFHKECVSISLPSIKSKDIAGNISSLIAAVKKTGLTFAPEAATEKLRSILAKDFNSEEFFKIMEQAFLSGYQHVKLYFIIGLPFEEEKDLSAIVDFALKVSELKRKLTRYPAQVNISVNTLIPKPHTAFQWFEMQDITSMKQKQDYLRKKLTRARKIKINFHNYRMSFLEGVLSRGDRRLSGVIMNAFNAGARFDAWEEHFNFEIWQAAFRESNIDPYFYLRQRLKDELFPWDFLDIGVNKEILFAEYNDIIQKGM